MPQRAHVLEHQVRCLRREARRHPGSHATHQFNICEGTHEFGSGRRYRSRSISETIRERVLKWVARKFPNFGGCGHRWTRVGTSDLIFFRMYSGDIRDMSRRHVPLLAATTIFIFSISPKRRGRKGGTSVRPSGTTGASASSHSNICRTERLWDAQTRELFVIRPLSFPLILFWLGDEANLGVELWVPGTSRPIDLKYHVRLKAFTYVLGSGLVYRQDSCPTQLRASLRVKCD